MMKAPWRKYTEVPIESQVYFSFYQRGLTLRCAMKKKPPIPFGIGVLIFRHKKG